MKASRTYTAGARPDESLAAFERCVKKNFRNSKRDQRNQPSKWAGGNLRVQRALIQKKQATHNHLQATCAFPDLAWTDANPQDREAAFAFASNKAVSLVETALNNY